MYSDVGAAESGGRWNSAGNGVVYASPVFSTTMLEKLVRMNSRPINQRFVMIEIPDDISKEVLARGDLPGWSDNESGVARTFGDIWLYQRRSAVLFVPSVVSPFDDNVLINLRHPEATRIHADPEQPFRWDPRLLSNE